MFYIIVFTSILGLIGSDLFVPSLPAIMTHFHQTQAHTQLTMSLFLVGYAVSQLFYGAISDYAGRKKPLIFGTSVFVIGSVICFFSDAFLWLCIGRLIEGIGVGAGLSLARVMIRDCYQGNNLMLKSSQLAIFITLAPAIAPFVGGFLQSYFGYTSAFLFLLCYGVLLLILICFFLPETIKEKSTTLNPYYVATQYVKILKNSEFMSYCIASGLAFSAIILYANTVPFIIENQLHLSASDSGIIILLAALGMSIGAFISSQLLRYLASVHLIQMGFLLFCFSGIFFVLSSFFKPTLLALMLPLFFVTIACGFILPNASAMAFSRLSTNLGVAAAIYGFIQISSGMCTNALLNTINHQGQCMLGEFYVVFSVIGIVSIMSAKAVVGKYRGVDCAQAGIAPRT